MNHFQNDNLSLQIWLNQSRSNKIQERKMHMNNQFILPPIIFFVKLQKYNKINIIKLFLSLKYIWKVLVSWYLFRKEKSKIIWVQSKGLIDLK